VNDETGFPEIPGFRILKLLGRGAMAQVFLAVDESLDRRVALKVMNQSLANDPTFRGRFIAEARDTAKFVHPGIVSIYSTGVHEGSYYLVLEYLEAGTLKDRQQARRRFVAEQGSDDPPAFGASEALVLLAQIADALSYLHGKNVIHRDIKPANVLFRSDGRAVLSDLGIAKSVSDHRDLTQTGFAVGTPAYMSPEQKLGAADLDGRSDLYSLGVVFYELLTGTKPFRVTSGQYEELRREQEAQVPVLPEPLAYLQPLLDKMLARDRKDRFGTAGELSRALREFSRSAGSVDSDETVIQRPAKRSRESRWSASGKRVAMIGSIGIVVVVALVLASISVLRHERAPEEEPVDPETAQTIAGLKRSAEAFMEENELISGCPSCAWEVYDRIERLQRGNQDAAAAKQAIRQEVLVQISDALDQGNTAEALDFIGAAEFYFGAYPDTLEELAGLRERAGQ